MNISRRETVNPYGPPLPKPPVFEEHVFKTFLLAKRTTPLLVHLSIVIITLCCSDQRWTRNNSIGARFQNEFNFTILLGDDIQEFLSNSGQNQERPGEFSEHARQYKQQPAHATTEVQRSHELDAQWFRRRSFISITERGLHRETNVWKLWQRNFVREHLGYVPIKNFSKNELAY